MWVKLGLPRRFKLRVEVGEIASLEKGIVREVDSRRNVLGHEGDLFGFREEVVGHAIEHQSTDGDRGQDFLRNDLRRIENVEFEGVGELLIKQLQTAAPIPGSCRS